MDDKNAVNQFYGMTGVDDKTIATEDVLKDCTVSVLSIYKHRGDIIDSSCASSSRNGVVVVNDGTEIGLRIIIFNPFSKLDCFDINEKSIIRRDLNLNLFGNSTNTYI